MWPFVTQIPGAAAFLAALPRKRRSSVPHRAGNAAEECMPRGKSPQAPWRAGWSLVGVLAALVILSTVLFGLFRLNHKGEMSFYATSFPHNLVRFEAWALSSGTSPETLVSKVELIQINNTPTYKIQSEEVVFYVVPPK